MDLNEQIDIIEYEMQLAALVSRAKAVFVRRQKYDKAAVCRAVERIILDGDTKLSTFSFDCLGKIIENLIEDEDI